MEQTSADSGRLYTLSLACPGSIIDGVSLEAAAFIAGSIARVAVAFCVDEIIVYDDTASPPSCNTLSAATAFLARALQWIETPPYLRQALSTPVHHSEEDLRVLRSLPALSAPHHLQKTDWRPFREGVVIKADAEEGCSYVDVGLDRNALVEGQVLAVGARVTLSCGDAPTTRFQPSISESVIIGKPVLASLPREQHGLYCGFNVRIAHGLSRVFTACPFKGGYDLAVGTSERGVCSDPSTLQLPNFKHMLLAFGGAQGLEGCLAADVDWTGREPSDIFNLYINTCPEQGGRTIRTEDSIPISLGYLQTAIRAFGKQ
ncbi:MAG: hypothetical protein WDW38_005457 [Sanguina aurantia]